MNNITASLDIQGLSQFYQRQQVLDNVSLTLYPGQLLAVLGPNGAGKTTLIRTLLGLVAPASGQIHLMGQLQQGAVRSMALRRQLGVMLQIGSASANLTVREQCDLFASYYPDGKTVAELLQLAGLTGQQHCRFGRLSGGQKQRLLFALALAGNPKLVFLDEPTLGMDVQARQSLWQQIQLLKAQGVAIVLTTHYLQEAEQLADQIAVLQQGRIIARDSPAQLTARLGGRQISCHTNLDDDSLLALPGVQQLKRQQQQVLITSQSAEQTLRALLQADSNLSQLEVKNAALEQVFLQLTQSGAHA